VSQPAGLSGILNTLSAYRWGAHHPDCSFHDHHIIRIMKHPFCLGCVSMYSGIVIGALILFALHEQGIAWRVILLVGLGLTPLPYLQMHYQKKWFKIFARVGLGIGSVLFIGAPLFFATVNPGGILIRIVIITIYVMLSRHALSRRHRKMNRPCDTCTEGVFPLCSWNEDKILAASKNADLDNEGKEFLQMVAQSVCAPPQERMVVTLSASDFD
tara:strand:+ start:270 stop:911 length:642 start_codon:yes stop_codon:yes gene_type:complete